MSIYRSLLLLLALLAACSARPINPGKIIAALNCGTKDAEVDSFDKSFKYKADSAFVSGDSVEVDYQTNDEAKDSDIKYPPHKPDSPSRRGSTCTSVIPTRRCPTLSL